MLNVKTSIWSDSTKTGVVFKDLFLIIKVILMIFFKDYYVKPDLGSWLPFS